MPSQRADQIVEAVVLKLAGIRKEKGVSINKLAWMSGISPKGIAFIEQKVNSPTLRNMLRMAEALDIGLARLLAEAEKEIPEK